MRGTSIQVEPALIPGATDWRLLTVELELELELELGRMSCLCGSSSAFGSLSKLGRGEGYICTAPGKPHWLCSACSYCPVGSRSVKCSRHHATAVPVGRLWDETRMRPAEMAAVPEVGGNLPELGDVRVTVDSTYRGSPVLKCTVTLPASRNEKQPWKQAALLRTILSLRGRREVRYAVLWPPDGVVQEAYMFPQPHPAWAPSLSGPASIGPVAGQDTVVSITKAEWWPAHRANKTFLGIDLDVVRAVLGSPCARKRWWFMAPFTPPPRIIPDGAKREPGQFLDLRPPSADKEEDAMSAAAAAFGPACRVARVKSKSKSRSKSRTNEGTEIRCVWCGERRSTLSEFRSLCAPDMGR